ncbi:tyrosine-protein phosphatase [Arthrobacter sp. 2RAF6]|uniref:tyrosine-protein phosphatase n=1 Tax=Arthrobacter sp. 2RAF6 TaxID=3233002 RepID=UPI003F8F35C4
MAENKVRTLKVEGLVNGRDLGGLRRVDGTVTPRGIFFRSENVDWITGNGWQQVYDAGIRTVVDLRQQRERNTDTRERPGWLTTSHVDLDGLENKEFWADYWDNGLVGAAIYFLPHLAAMPERAGIAMTEVLNAPAGEVLFHCMGGRDRTGLLAMALLHAIGTDPECIVDDYLETVRLGDARAANGERNNAEPRLEELCRQHGTTTEAAFRDALANFDLQTFLDAAELADKDREGLFTWRGATAACAYVG